VVAPIAEVTVDRFDNLIMRIERVAAVEPGGKDSIVTRAWQARPRGVVSVRPHTVSFDALLHDASGSDDQSRPSARERTLMAKLNINGKIRDVQAEPDMPLLWVIREQVGLTGTKFGCGIAQCGACSVHINGEVQRSCSIRLSDVKPSDKIVTIEGLSPNASHPVQKAWLAIDVPQCGYCQSGQIMAAAALLKKTPKPTDRDIDEAMTNICRCGTYQRIRAAVHMAAGMGTGSGSVAPAQRKRA
jgi:isoquinoline 1-oxidoreductase alpha subunit